MPLTTAEKQLQVLPFARPWSLSVAPVHLLSTRYDNEPVQVIGQPPGANYLTSVLSVVSGCRRWFQMILHFPGLPACTFIWLCSSLWLWGHSTAVKTRINLREKEKEILDEILGPGRYDRRIRPAAVNGTDGPVVVDVNLLFRSFPTISDQDMEYSTILTFREEWMDERLRYSDLKGKIKYLTLTDSEKIWMPDLFFSNERDGHFHNLIVPNVYVRIYPNGHVLYSIRISLTLSCPMNLRMFPMDQQTCSLAMASYGYTTDDLVFVWKSVDPVQVATNLNLPRFHLETFETDTCNSVTNTGEYSCLKVNLKFRRDFSYYVIQIYIPCCMLIIVSWFSFWLDASASPARVTLGITTFLTMATQTSSISDSLPPVSYTKAIDVWTGVCMTFVFCALLEYALVNKFARSDKRRENRLKQRREAEMAAERSLQDDGCPNTDRAKSIVYVTAEPEETGCCSTTTDDAGGCLWIAKFQSRSKRIDIISRILFPLMFGFFNLVYWSTYLSGRDMLDRL